MNTDERLDFLIKRKNEQYKYLLSLKKRFKSGEFDQERYNLLRESAWGVLDNILKEIGKINGL